MIGAGLLVSVRNADEACAALRGGADIIDVKEPRHGALGCAAPEVAAEIAAVVAPAAPWTVALGELTDGLPAVRQRLEALGAALPLATPPPAAVKVGLAGVGDRAWEADLAALFACVVPPTVPIAVAYADWQQVGAPDPLAVIAAAGRLGGRWLLIDTAVKGEGRGLFAGVAGGREPGIIAAWIASARCQGLAVALAGSLTLEQLPDVGHLGADVVGLRSAVCSGGRFGRVREDRVRQAAAALGRSDGATVAALRRTRWSQELV